MSNVYHILNGDALKEQIADRLEGKMIIMRECLIEGPLTYPSGDLQELFQKRAQFLTRSNGGTAEYYFVEVAAELEKLIQVENGAILNFWFEDDLFCQTNFWFLVHLTRDKSITRSLIRPHQLTRYGFGAYNFEGLQGCFQKRKEILLVDELSNLWEAYANGQSEKMKQIASQLSDEFSFISAAVNAHISRIATNFSSGEPLQILAKLVEEFGIDSFKKIFDSFSSQAPIYGFGDLQVKRLLQQLENDSFHNK
ncbi:MAG: DUF1835 domain-containing protein [Bacteroidota bacterium]